MNFQKALFLSISTGAASLNVFPDLNNIPQTFDTFPQFNPKKCRQGKNRFSKFLTTETSGA